MFISRLFLNFMAILRKHFLLRRSVFIRKVINLINFIEVLMGTQTTFNRPIVNSRDEALCGTNRDMARLHVIFYDSNLCEMAGYLKVGVLQIILTMIEAEQVNVHLILEDPVVAVRAWSRDPGLTTPIGNQRCFTISRRRMMASFSRHTSRRKSALLAFAFDTSTVKSFAAGS